MDFFEKRYYIEQPLGFTHPYDLDHVCKLNKAIYGLKQVPRAQRDRFSHFLLHVGFFYSNADSLPFVLHSPIGAILLLLYLDDIIVTSNKPSLLCKLITNLNSEFAMKDLGHLHHFLGIEITPFSNGLFLSQSKYVGDLLLREKMLHCKTISSPLTQNMTSTWTLFY